MVGPVSNIGPRVIRFGHLPLYPFPSHPVGVISIGRAGVHEGCDHALDVFRIGISQCFPVLEKVTPVPLVIQAQAAILILEIDGELVPWTAGIAVPAAESQRKVSVTQAFQVGIVALGSQG